MPDQAFQRTPLYPLEKPLADDINQDSSQQDRALRDLLFNLYGGASGFINGGFNVVEQSPPALGVVIKAGLAFQDAPTDVPTNIGGVVGLNDLSRYKPIVLAQDYSVAVPTPPGSNSRIDLIEVAYSRRLDNSQSRNFLNTGTGAFAPSSVAKTLDFSADGTLAYYAATDVPTTALAYKSGVAGVSPSAPSVDTGYMAVAQIVVSSGAVTIITSNITDERVVIFPPLATFPITWPSELPTATTPLYMDPSGDITFIPGASVLSIPVAMAYTTATDSSVTRSGHSGGGAKIQLLSAGAETAVEFPIDLPVGSQITGWKIWATKGSNGSTTLTGNLAILDPVTDIPVDGTTATNSANAPGAITLEVTGFSFITSTARSYSINLSQGDGHASAIDTVFLCEVTYFPPSF